MSDWALKLNEEFDKNFAELFANISRSIKAALAQQSPDDADIALTRLNNFIPLASTLKAMKAGEDSAFQKLRFFENDKNGNPVYFLASGRIRILFYVDHQNKLCIPMFVQELDFAKAISGTFKGWFGRRI